MPGRSVRLFFVDGNAGGLVTAEVMNWTGHLLVAPRSLLADALARDEAARTGVYILLGEDPDQPSRTRIYVGEGDNVSARLKMHARDVDKDFWTRVVIVTSKDTNLTKAHVRFLESEMIRLAKAAGRASLANGNEPGERLLPEADRSDMAVFLSNFEAVLPAIGVDFLRPTRLEHRTHADEGQDSAKPVTGVELTLAHRSGVLARAIEMDGEIIVLSGSQVQANRSYAMNQYQDLRDQLIRDRIIVPASSDNGMIFAADYAFKSPSAAPAVIIGRNANGRSTWKLASGQSLGEWQDSRLSFDDLLG